MNPPQSVIENSLVSATQAAHDPVYREALWVSVVFTGMVIAAALLEWLKSSHPIILGELLVLIETAAVYARAALVSRLRRRDDALMEFLTGIILGPLAILAVLSSLSLLVTPVELNPPNFLKLFSLVVAIEFLSVFVLLEERPSTVSLSELFGPRIFAWVSHCALVVAGTYSILAPNAAIDAALGLCVASLCMLSAANNIHSAVTRMAAE